MSGGGDNTPIVEGSIPLGDVHHPASAASLPRADGGDGPLTLSLNDLIPDAHGEVVILNHGGGEIAVITGQEIAASGVEDAHVTAAGLDVTGYAFLTFSGGITVFYPADHQILVTADG